MSIYLYGCTTWTLTKRIEKKLDSNSTRILRDIWDTSWKQHLTKEQQYGHQPPISKTIQIRQTRHAGHELISDVLPWTPSLGRAGVWWPAITYLQQLSTDSGCCLEDLPEAIDDRDEWRERVRETRASGTTWWCWWWYVCIQCQVLISSTRFTD